MEKELNARDRWLTEDEESRLFAVAVWWVRELVTFAIHTGMRRGEILALTWAGVDFTRRTVTVFQSKNGERRTMPVNQTVLDLLAQKRAQRSGATKILEQDFVFVSQSCTPIDSSNLRRRFVSSLKAAQITDFHFHDLRHTFATRLVQAGVDLYKVQRLLGHKSPSMTQRYAHHYPESLRDGVDVLDRKGRISTNLVQRGEAATSVSLTC
ncbi:MAG: putative Integrase [Nitrospira sp.]|nr:putative Integrase [Nitrospira sp.]